MATTTPNYGWDVPTSTDYVKDGATAIETLGDDIDATLYTALGGAYPGLRLVKKQTIGSGVSSVTVSDAFSATYESYKIIVSGGAVATGNPLLNLQVGGVTTGYKSCIIYTTWNGGVTSQQSAATNRFFGIGVATTTGINAHVELASPFRATQTTAQSNFAESNFGGGISSGVLPTTTSYTSFTIYPDSSTFSGGTIYVYGYGMS